MRISARSFLSTGVIAALALAVIPAPALAADASPARLTLSVVGTQAQASAAQIRPGVVEVTIGDTFTIPGDEPAPDQLAIVSTADLPYVLSQFGAIFGDPTAPGAGAAAAQGMRNVRAATTWYGGGFKGTTYQVVLPAGTYYVLDPVDRPEGHDERVCGGGVSDAGWQSQGDGPERGRGARRGMGGLGRFHQPGRHLVPGGLVRVAGPRK